MQKPNYVYILRLTPELRDRLKRVAPSRKGAVIVRQALEKELTRLENEMVIAA